jgi:hypothetical protein
MVCYENDIEAHGMLSNERIERADWHSVGFERGTHDPVGFGGVLDSLDGSDDQVPSDSIARAQNRLLDAILEYCKATADQLAHGLVRQAAS